MPAVRTGPVFGLVGQAVVLVALDRTAGLGAAGWLAGAAYGLALFALLSRGMDRSGTTTLSPADRVTLLRATLVGAVTALAAERHQHAAALVAIASVALALDWVDGRVARSTGTVSALGARFDMEVDAFLLLVLSGCAARYLGDWVLAIGLMRYAYVVVSLALPWLRGTLAPRYWRKVVAATQGVVLVVAVAGVVPTVLARVSVAVSLALLVVSFVSCVRLLWPAPQPMPQPMPQRAAAARAELRIPLPLPGPVRATAGAGSR